MSEWEARINDGSDWDDIVTAPEWWEHEDAAVGYVQGHDTEYIGDWSKRGGVEVDVRKPGEPSKRFWVDIWWEPSMCAREVRDV